jgi:hypothetical protein
LKQMQLEKKTEKEFLRKAKVIGYSDGKLGN